jgi:hypothetical protein
MTSGADNRIRRRKQLPDPSSTLGASIVRNTINPKTGLPRYPAALCYWNTGGKRWFFQSREPKLTAVLRTIKGARPYLRSWQGGHLTAWAVDCTATKARSVVRSLTRALNEISAHSKGVKIAQEPLLLSGREGGENDPNWVRPAVLRGDAEE